MPATRAPKNMALIATRRRGFETNLSPNVASVAAGGLLPLVVGSSGVDPYATRSPQNGDVWLDFSAGSDGSGSQLSPWNTFTSARLRALSAGQALWVKGTGAWPDTGSGALSGTSGNRILVKVWPSSTGTFTFSGAGAQTGGGAYWDVAGLTLQCVYTGICTGDNYAFTGGAGRSTNWRFIDCVGTRSASVSPVDSHNDNTGIIYCGSNASSSIQVIRGSYTGPSGESNNQSNLWFDYADNLLILGVLIDQASNPIYFKHTTVNSSGTPGGVVKNCIIRRAGRGLQASLNYVQYINNAFDACILGLDEDGGGIAGGNNCVLSHNTFLNSDVSMAITSGGTHKHQNNVFTNNAWLGTGRLQDNPFGANTNEDQLNSSDYSVCEGTGTAHFYRNSTQRTLAQHKAAFSGQEAHGVAGTITLVGGTTPGTSPGNWAMLSGVGKSAASDGTDCGVNASNLLTVN